MEQPIRYKLTLCFEGTAYSGWQKQPQTATVQQTLEEALSAQLDTLTYVRGSSRTDAGVHAREFIAHFDTLAIDNTLSFKEKLNAYLPSDIRIIDVVEAPAHFHACFSAKKKHYLYRFSLDPIPPFERHYITHLRGPIHIKKMEQALPFFLGTHNFLSFANQGDKGAAKNSPIKTIYSLTLEKEKSHYVLHVHGNGFLYKMVRNMVGALVEVGRGTLEPSGIAHLLSLQNRKVAPPPAPAQGLCLEKVYY